MLAVLFMSIRIAEPKHESVQLTYLNDGSCRSLVISHPRLPNQDVLHFLYENMSDIPGNQFSYLCACNYGPPACYTLNTGQSRSLFNFCCFRPLT